MNTTLHASPTIAELSSEDTRSSSTHTENLQSRLHASALESGTQITSLTSEDHVDSLRHEDHIETVELELVLTTATGHEYSIPLDKLTPEQRFRLNQLLQNADDGVIDIYDAMNPARGTPSKEALELGDLIRTAVGHPISFSRGHKVFIANGSFLRNYTVDDKFRDRAISQPHPRRNDTTTNAEKTRIHNQYHCGKNLLAFSRRRLEKQKAKLQQECDQPGVPARIKSKLQSRIRQLDEAIKFYDTSNPRNPSPIRENAILTAALYPLDLTGLTHSQAKDALANHKNRIKEALDKHVVHGRMPFISDRFNASNPNYESRSEREGYQFFPFGCSDKSGFEAARQGFADDIAEAELTRDNSVHCEYSHLGSGKKAGPESFFMEIQKLAASNASNDDIHEAIVGQHSHFSNAFRALDPKDRAEVADSIFHAAIALRDIAASTQIRTLVAASADAAALRTAFDAEFDKQVAADPLLA